MHAALPWLAFLVGMLGNCGGWLFCFNRVNAFGLPRPIAKVGEKLCMGLCFFIPASVYYSDPALVHQWLTGDQFWPPSSSASLHWWLLISLTCLVVLGPLWLESRRWLIPPSNLVHSEAQLFDVHRQLKGGSANNLSTRLWARVPLNEWAHLEVSRKTLRLPREIVAAEGLTIGHISDLHFTGQYRQEHYQFVIARLMEHHPELIVISGDIIDFQHCMSYVETVFSKLSAPLGCYFVLGNHERRLTHVPELIDRLNQLGFIDAGVSDRRVSARGLQVIITGNESPWFHRRKPTENCNHATGISGDPMVAPKEIIDGHFHGNTLRMGVAHSPDCIGWARRQKLDLLLTGHTHGGQARFPIIGPLVAPSLHGSKFASGLFFLPPTLMHVSRGVAGTHTVRWRCPPEVSILTLTNPE